MTTVFKNKLLDLERQGMLRQFMPLNDRRSGHVRFQGRDMVNLSSNDYLGLAGDEGLLELFYQKLIDQGCSEDFRLGVASSRLLTGDTPASHRLEALLTSLYGSEACLLFNSGYHANIGIIPAIFGKGDLVLSDKLNHASLHDGLRIARAEAKRFRHADYHHLEKLLQDHREKYDKAVIVSESIFSMDGDSADLEKLVALKKKYDCMLYLDEAHGIGLYGDNGLGLAEEKGFLEEIDLLVGTFGKACGSVGAYLICEKDIYHFLVNNSRSLIFTTALPPVTLSWNHFVMERIPEMKDRRLRLRSLSQKLRREIEGNNLQTGGESNIIPVIIGDAAETVAGAAFLQEQGFLVMPVRPPTVPKGSSRFRLSLTADLAWDEIENIPKMIRNWLDR